MTKRYCEPWNCGLASETTAVQRRLGRLLDTLANEINSNIVKGDIEKDIRDFRISLIDKLQADGWTMSYDGGNRMKVRAPGHRKPFATRMV